MNYIAKKKIPIKVLLFIYIRTASATKSDYYCVQTKIVINMSQTVGNRIYTAIDVSYPIKDPNMQRKYFPYRTVIVLRKFITTCYRVKI
jgi:hypothetical protein